jgi:mono/diheme cytochrome c family protein
MTDIKACDAPHGKFEHAVLGKSAKERSVEVDMRSRAITFFCVALLAVYALEVQYHFGVTEAATSTAQSDRPQLPPTYIPSGKSMFTDYCASCHGPDGKGLGPVSSLFRKPPPDLTILSKSHGGVFPSERVTHVLQFGPGISAHGSTDMPVWGPIFRIVDNYNEAAVKQRIENLCKFIESIQEK